MSNLAFSKANQIITVLVKAGTPMHVEDIASEARLRRNSLEKLIAMLEYHGWVIKTHETISIGPVLRDLGLAVLSLDNLPQRAEPIMTNLFEATKLDVGLCIFTAPSIVFVKKVGFTSHPNAPAIGTPYEAHTMANGRCILGSYSDAYVQDYIAEFLSDEPADWIAEKVIRPVEETRKRGFGMTTADRLGHVEAICAPVFSASGEAIGAINLWRPSEKITDRPSDEMMDYVPAILEAAAEISATMGARPGTDHAAAPPIA